MKLDRNTGNGRGKYGIVKVRRLRHIEQNTDGKSDSIRQEVADAVALLERAGVLTFGGVGSPDEFFVLMLKDKYADKALAGYLNAVLLDRDTKHPADQEYADDIDELWERAGRNSKHCKRPD